MDGINPTLAFVILLYGLSGNAPDAANDPAAEINVEDGSGCSVLMITGDPPEPASKESWTGAFWDSAISASVLPDVIDPKWADAAFPKIERADPTGAPALLMVDQRSDPIVRRTVAAGVLAAAAERDPCEAER
jgi:hypothetical protein